MSNKLADLLIVIFQNGHHCNIVKIQTFSPLALVDCYTQPMWFNMAAHRARWLWTRWKCTAETRLLLPGIKIHSIQLILKCVSFFCNSEVGDFVEFRRVPCPSEMHHCREGQHLSTSGGCDYEYIYIYIYLNSHMSLANAGSWWRRCIHTGRNPLQSTD